MSHSLFLFLLAAYLEYVVLVDGNICVALQSESHHISSLLVILHVIHKASFLFSYYN